MSNETQEKQAQTKEQAQNASLANLRRQFAEELERDTQTANQLSQQLQALANKREQLRGAIYAMDAAMATLANEGKTGDGEAKAEETAKASAEAAAETKAEAKEEAAAEAVTAEAKG